MRVEHKFGARGDILSGEPRFFAKEVIVRVGMFKADLICGEHYEPYQKLKKMNVNEGSCQSMLYHYEPASVKGIITRSLRYGESMQTFAHHSKKQVFQRVMRHSLLTWGETLSELSENPGMTLGCSILLGMKAFAMMTGLLANLA